MLNALDCTEKVISDNGYQHEGCTTPKTVIPEDEQSFQQIRARHKTCNARFAIFGISQQTFCHEVPFHGVIFHAVAKITHVIILHDSTPFSL